MANKKLSKSNEHLEFEDIAEIYNYREKSLKEYFNPNRHDIDLIFAGLTESDIFEELEYQILEIERDACLNLMASIEAKFRLDYAIRCEEKDKEDISRKFREFYADYELRLPLEEVIFEEWKLSGIVPKAIISELRGAFKYRHWLAHGRYWTLKAGRPRYDFYSLYSLALGVDSFPLKKVN